VTVRVTTLKGADSGAYYVETLPNYYLQSGEPRGVWFGEGAQRLGLAGDVDDAAFLALMAGVDPRRPDRHLGRRYDETSVRGFDITCSAPKSVSVLFGLGDGDTRREVLAAHDAAVAALTGWIERHAHTRYRIGGEVVVVDAEGIIAARFRQHTSRALDPQLHTHVVMPNRVASPDGRWLALDARLIKHDQRSLSAIYHAGLRAELSVRLGVAWGAPEYGIAEIRGVPDDVLAEFSTRTDEVRRRLDAKLDRFVDTMGRDPTARERWAMEREAVVDSRPGKAETLEAALLHAQWADQVAQLGYEPARVITDAIEQVAPRSQLDGEASSRIIARALTAMAEQQSTWRPTELHREIGGAVPTDLAVRAAELVDWMDRAVADAVVLRCVELSRPVPPEALLRRDGRPITESIVDRALSTQAIIDQEDALIAWAARRLAYHGGVHPSVDQHSPVALDAAQCEAASAVAGADDLVLVVGPAGTGKTTALAPGVAQLRADGRAAFGVAPSAAAAAVLAEETGIRADTLDKLLLEHRLARLPADPYNLAVGTTVIVDEAGMLSTAKLAELADLADVKGWRVVLVGDPQQFSAVGRGGMFGLLVYTFGAVELERVHRFRHGWEREASLRLRRGDVAVAELYDANGRLQGGTPARMERAAVARWWEVRHAGSRALLMTPTNETVELLNERCQHVRLRAGEIDPAGPHAKAGPHRVFVGDEIATRHNDRRLVTDAGDMVRNRATWTVTDVHVDGSLTVAGRSGVVFLPAAYVADHVELAYATTGAGAQGRTVEVGLLFLDGPTDVRNLYVPMTRGTETNEAFIVTTGEERAVDVFARSLATDRIDVPAHTRRDELHGESPHRPGLLDGRQLRQLLEERHEITTTLATAAQKPVHHFRLGEIDGALHDDQRVRCRMARLEQPDAVVDMLGERPAGRPGAQAWDAAAGQILQHQAAFDLSYGLGPNSELPEGSAFAQSREAAWSLLETLAQPANRRDLVAEIEGVDIDL
jgi:conjugative relaxase-like TrwC/TraI family protein